MNLSKMEINRYKANTENIQSYYEKLLYSVSTQSSLFLDSSLASLFSLLGICALDNHNLLLIAQSQIHFVILSQSTDLQLLILFMQCTAVVLSESIFM